MPSEWLQQESRFRAINSAVDGLWSRKVGSTATKWQAFPAHKVTKRDLQRFDAEVAVADDLLRRTLGLDPGQFRITFGPTALDRWLNAVTSLGVHPGSDMQLASSNQGVKGEGGRAENLAEMSAIACTRLATGMRPAPTRLPAADSRP